MSYGSVVEALHTGLCLAIYWPHFSVTLSITSTVLHLVTSHFCKMWVWFAVGQGTGAWPCSGPRSLCSAFCNMVGEEMVTHSVNPSHGTLCSLNGIYPACLGAITDSMGQPILDGVEGGRMDQK